MDLQLLIVHENRKRVIFQISSQLLNGEVSERQS